MLRISDGARKIGSASGVGLGPGVALGWAGVGVTVGGRKAVGLGVALCCTTGEGITLEEATEAADGEQAVKTTACNASQQLTQARVLRKDVRRRWLSAGTFA